MDGDKLKREWKEYKMDRRVVINNTEIQYNAENEAEKNGQVCTDLFSG